MALAVAMFLNRDIKGINLIRTLYYIPSLFGGSVAVALLWRLMFLDNGVMNAMLTALHLPNVQFIGDTRYALKTICALEIWQFGSSMVMFLAALKQVPKSLYEAAQIDGAGKARMFFSITLPLLKGVIKTSITFWSINTTTFFLWTKMFSPIDTEQSTIVPVVYLYDMVFGGKGVVTRDAGAGAAVGVVLTLIIIAVYLITNRLFRGTDLEY